MNLFENRPPSKSMRLKGLRGTCGNTIVNDKYMRPRGRLIFDASPVPDTGL